MLNEAHVLFVVSNLALVIVALGISLAAYKLYLYLMKKEVMHYDLMCYVLFAIAMGVLLTAPHILNGEIPPYNVTSEEYRIMQSPLCNVTKEGVMTC